MAHVHDLMCLSDDDSWSLFKQRAFEMGMDEGNVNLEKIGRQIVQRCGGVPLAIKATGSILHFKSQESEWLRVKESEIWDLKDEGRRILGVLRLSYKHLPPYMRQCFLFCSIFPKDYVMEKDKLIGLWMANGFIPSRGHMDLHDTGCEIFSELTWKSFLQDVKEHVHGIVTCKMHDLVHDLATSMMDKCYRKLNKFVVGKDNDSGGMDELKELDIEGELNITGLGNVKSATEAKTSNLINKQNLISLSLFWRRDSNETFQHGNDEEILNALQPHSSLKKLYIYGYQGVRFPYWMMDMLLPNLVQILLEYCNRCNQLPPLGKLCFLKVLTIFGMGDLKYIESSFNGDMESSFPSLEVLKILWAPCLEEWTAENGCPMLVKLLMLQSLKELDIRGSSVTLLKSLMMNATVLISLHIWEFYELRDLSDLLDNLLALEHLNLKSCSQLESLHAGLQNFSSLETLELSHCNSLVSLPVNGLQELSSLSTLRIEKCKKLASMSKGVRYLTSLQNLHIRKCPELTSLPECIQHLSSLRFLNIKECKGLVSLPNEIQHLTLLSRLEILNCPNLMSLPQGVRNLLALKTLWIEECSHLERQCQEERGEDWPNIAHIPNIYIK
ncbi:putative disease resistance protein RGA1 [Gossypium raimondii]|nr:putative disease resistance protein RGA1 [Gossypium raimondii]